MAKPQILLTNDDGIRSPGLWAAAQALSQIGFVTVVAPRDQSSGAGRSHPISSDGLIREETIEVNGEHWKVYAVGGTPAQVVLRGIFEIMPNKPDLVVSGINYGENLATSITISGTVGAAMEAAALGIPALAMSLATDQAQHLTYSTDVDFTTAAYFTMIFSQMLLKRHLPKGVDLIKVDVPADATTITPWEWTQLSRQRYYMPTKPKRTSWDITEPLGYEININIEAEPHNSDVYTLIRKQHVSVTPLTLDMTARVAENVLNQFAKQASHPRKASSKQSTS